MQAVSTSVLIFVLHVACLCLCSPLAQIFCNHVLENNSVAPFLGMEAIYQYAVWNGRVR